MFIFHHTFSFAFTSILKYRNDSDTDIVKMKKISQEWDQTWYAILLLSYKAFILQKYSFV